MTLVCDFFLDTIYAHSSEDNELQIPNLVKRMYDALWVARARSNTVEHLKSGRLPVFPFIWIENSDTCKEDELANVMTPFINRIDEFPVLMTVSDRKGVERLRKCA
jgi:hypothetical protein